MQIIIGSDHAGVELKREIIEFLQNEGYDVLNCGTDSSESVDYPDIAQKVAEQVLKLGQPGIIICGTGIGISIAANKIAGIRAALCQNTFMARLARQHNDANILALGARVTGSGLALDIVKAFLAAEFEAGRHQRRVDKIKSLEKKITERSH
jgi:RpiB/LacA/LacB family sugar-phosphate isomerase